MQNILVVDCRMYQSSGIGRYLQNIVPGLIRYYKTRSTTIILLGNLKELQFLETCVEVIEFAEPIYSIREQFVFRKLISKCDIFWSPHYNIPVFSVPAKHLVVTIHDVFHLAHAKSLNLKQRVYAHLLINLATHKAEDVITVSEFSKSEIQARTFIKPKRITRIYNGVNCLSENLVSIPDDNYFLYVGNVKPHKNLKNAILAYKKFLEFEPVNRATKKFVIVGKREGFITGDENLINLIETDLLLKDNVLFTGYVDDDHLAGYYKNAFCLVFPSIYEGFGLPPLEAMLYDTPCIVSNTASMPEICGDAVLYFDPFDFESIFNQMRQISNEDGVRIELIEKGRRRIDEFTWEHCLREHIQLFNSLLTS
ncbi:glycosyltransferase family 4 protein [Leeuwenhoekiella polynyae]|uniref:Glycosyltransferase involved in cell wall biosynthesis n=1 Tax=Leeuwenhoekiella polynyae TaxID=1550906 RepID=A0A4Q0NUC1_9FLAO|nr:glycosyltransferase family 1 protein [Leeuwenhoekiella polynyae]RXG14684.1 glycosyltransferase involved in cell wall biosynthesis [Leeuwenhoekiella polynyae]